MLDTGSKEISLDQQRARLSPVEKSVTG